MIKESNTFLSKEILNKINKQITLEHQSANYYLAFASWCSYKGYEGAAKFLFAHSNEELMHRDKFIHYVLDSGEQAIISEIEEVNNNPKSLKEIFEIALLQEIKVGNSIKDILYYAIETKDHYTNNFLQWFMEEQREEICLMKKALKLFDVIENDIWRIDNEIKHLKTYESTSIC